MKHITIGGIPYTLIFSNDMRTVSADTHESSLLLGQTDYHTRTFRLYETKIADEQGIVFLHELVHAIIEAYHITVMIDPDGRHVEDNVDRLAVGLYEALKSMKISIPKYLKDAKK